MNIHSENKKSGFKSRMVKQVSDYDCMVCCLAMYCNCNYDEIVEAARTHLATYDPGTTALSPALMRRVAHSVGAAMLSSIYFDWRFPGIIGVPSLTFVGEGHAIFWDGETLFDPGSETVVYDREYVEREAVEYAQRASDIAAVFALDEQMRQNQNHK